MPRVRWFLPLALAVTLVAPPCPGAYAGSTGAAPSAASAGSRDAEVDTRAGVIAAIMCGTALRLWAITGYGGFFAIGVTSCIISAADALVTPD